MSDLQSAAEEINHLVHVDTSEKVVQLKDVQASLVSSAAADAE